jgi:hypothetical protein
MSNLRPVYAGRRHFGRFLVLSRRQRSREGLAMVKVWTD